MPQAIHIDGPLVEDESPKSWAGRVVDDSGAVRDDVRWEAEAEELLEEELRAEAEQENAEAVADAELEEADGER